MRLDSTNILNRCKAVDAYSAGTAVLRAFSTAPSTAESSSFKSQHGKSNPSRKLGPRIQNPFAKTPTIQEHLDDPPNTVVRNVPNQGPRSFGEPATISRDSVEGLTNAEPEELSRENILATSNDPGVELVNRISDKDNNNSKLLGELLYPLRKAKRRLDLVIERERIARSSSEYRIFERSRDEDARHHPRRNSSEDFKMAWKSHMFHMRKAIRDIKKQKISLTEYPDGVLARIRDDFDYIGYTMELGDNLDRGSSGLPWAIDSHNNLQGSQVLEREIGKFARFVELTSAEKAARQSVAAESKKLIMSVLGSDQDLQQNVYGSEVNGLCVPESDIDIRLFKTDGYAVTQKTRDTTKLYAALTVSDSFGIPKQRKGQFPLIDARHLKTGIKVQFIWSNDLSRQQELVASELKSHPYLREAYLLTRIMLGSRGLNEVVHGGLGSYGIFCLLLAILKAAKQSTREANYETSDSVLLAILNYFQSKRPEPWIVSSTERNVSLMEMDRDQLHSFSASSEAEELALTDHRVLTPWLLCLQDPADSSNDVGRISYAIKHVHETLKSCNRVLRTEMRKINRAQRGVATSDVESLLLPLIGRYHDRVREHRGKMEIYGQEILDAGRLPSVK